MKHQLPTSVAVAQRLVFDRVWWFSVCIFWCWAGIENRQSQIARNRQLCVVSLRNIPYDKSRIK
jgi:hypothetical protein